MKMYALGKMEDGNLLMCRGTTKNSWNMKFTDNVDLAKKWNRKGDATQALRYGDWEERLGGGLKVITLHLDLINYEI